MKLADYVSLIRLVFGPITAFILYLKLKYPESYSDLGSFWSFWAVAIFYLVFLFTDWLDGRFAKIYGETRFGAWFDPLADKVLNWSYSAVLVFGVSEIAQKAGFAFSVLFIGDCYSTFKRAVGYKKANKNIKANWWGKFKMGFHSGAIFLFLLTFVFHSETINAAESFWGVWTSALGFIFLSPAIVCAAISLHIKYEEQKEN